MGLVNHLAERRRHFNLSQSELGHRVGISRQAIHNVESGKTVPPVDVALRLAHALGESVENLFQTAELTAKSKERPEDLIERILPLRSALRERGVAHLSLFGSHARGDARESSDVDVLVDPDADRFSLFDLVWVREALERQLKRRVDVVTKRSLHRDVAQRVLRDQVHVF